MTTDLLTAARQWFDAGYCVVPTHEDGGKRPFGPWKQYQGQRLGWDELQQLLRSGRHTGIGVLTGAVSGNVEMIEIEGPLEVAVNRIAKVKAEAAQFGDTAELLTRVTKGCAEQSAGGGLHVFLRVTDGPALGNVKLAHTDGKVVAETRGEGGFVVVAPTPGRNGHPTGSAYALLKGCTPAGTAEVTSEERDLIHYLFTAALHTDPVITEPHPSDHEPTSTPTSGISALDDYRARVTWREILEPQGWTYSHSASDGREHWVRPGKSIHEGTSATTIEDGPLYCFSTTVGWPAEQGLSKGQVYALLHHKGDLSAASKALAAKGYGTAIHDHALPAWEAELDPEASEDEKTEAKNAWLAEHLPLLNWHDIWADDTAEEWIIEPILAKRRLVALYSAPKVGKSLLMLEIAAGIASGREVLGVKPPAPVRTLYVDFENDPRGDIRERLQDMGYTPDDLANLCYLSFPNLGKLDTARGADELLAAVEGYGCEVVVVDTVSRSVEGDENENDTWLAFYRHTGLALKRAKVAMIRLDHSGKDEKRGQRGGSAKSGDVDAVWRMSVGDVEDTFELVCEAQRFPISQKHLTLRRGYDSGHLAHEVMSNPARERHDYLIAEMLRLEVDPDLSITNATALLREAGVTVGKGRIPKPTWQAYQAIPKAFTIAQGTSDYRNQVR